MGGPGAGGRVPAPPPLAARAVLPFLLALGSGCPALTSLSVALVPPAPVSGSEEKPGVV